MAGEGSRFKKEGYKDAKPFIKFNGKTMIEHVLDGLKASGELSYTLIIQKSFFSEYQEQLKTLQDNYNVKFSVVEKQTVGALATALSAYEKMQPDCPVVFADSDNIFFDGVFDKFLKDAITRNLDGSLLTFNSSDEKFSYAEIDENGTLLRTREKEVISTHAIAGAYFFGKASSFINCAISTLIYPSEKNEYYMSIAYNTMVKFGKKCGIFEINESDFACVGTPLQLNAYLGK